MRIDDEGQQARSLGDHGRGGEGGREGQSGKWWSHAEAHLTLNLGWSTRWCAEEGLKEHLLEGRVAAGESEQLAKEPVVKNAVAGADGSLSVFERIPGDADARLKVVPVIVVKRRQALVFLPGDSEGESSRSTGIGKQRGQQIVHLVRNPVELIAQAIAESEVGEDFESVLREGIEFLLAETS